MTKPAPEYLPEPLETDASIVAARDAVEERRTLVWEMLMQGANVNHMARELKQSRYVIDNDVKSLKQALGEHVSTLRSSKDAVSQEIGEMMARLDWIFHNSIMEYSASSVAPNKNKFLNTALKAVQTKAQILVATGYLPKAGVKITIDAIEGASFNAIFGRAASALDDPVKRRKALEITAKILASTTHPKGKALEAILEGNDDDTNASGTDA